MIKQKDLDDAGVTRLQVSQSLGIPYGTLSAKINGYCSITEDEEKNIREFLATSKK